MADADDKRAWYQAFGDADPRVVDWAGVATPYPTLAVCLVYLVGIPCLQRWMSNRAAFSIRPVVVVHNVVLIAWSGYMTYHIFSAARVLGYGWICNGVVPSGAAALVLARMIHHFFISKAYEMVDTLLMCLRKKDDQVSFLHMYHHVSVLLLWWIGVRTSPGGDAYLSAGLNTTIHVLMYTYYLIAALGVRVDHSWKKRVTQLQLAQFFVNLLHASMCLVFGCAPPHGVAPWQYAGMVLYMLSFIVLFSMFYARAYNRISRPRTTKRE